jgi:hypothetical protein
MLTAIRSIKDKEGQVLLDYVPEDNTETWNAFRCYQVQHSISKGDIVNGTSRLAGPKHTTTNFP